MQRIFSFEIVFIVKNILSTYFETRVFPPFSKIQSGTILQVVYVIPVTLVRAKPSLDENLFLAKLYSEKISEWEGIWISSFLGRNCVIFQSLLASNVQ